MKIIEFAEGKVTVELGSEEAYYLSQGLLYGTAGPNDPHMASRFGISSGGYRNLSPSDMTTLLENASSALLAAAIALEGHCKGLENDLTIEAFTQRLIEGHPNPSDVIHADTRAS